MTKQEPALEGGRTNQIESKVKITDSSKNKSNTAKVNWFIARSGLLRVDILGPFDILMAQGFRDSSKVTLVDHRQKTVYGQSNNEPLRIDGFELPLNDLAFLLINQRPRGWNCKNGLSEKLECQKGPLESSWPNPKTLVVMYPPFELEIQILSSLELEKPNPSTFQFVWPKSYRVLSP